MLKIKKNVPIPGRFAADNHLPETFTKMDIGDSVELADAPNTAMIYYAAKRVGIKVTVRRIDSTHVQVWRIADEPNGK